MSSTRRTFIGMLAAVPCAPLALRPPYYIGIDLSRTRDVTVLIKAPQPVVGFTVEDVARVFGIPPYLLA